MLEVLVPFVTGWKLGGRGEFSSARDDPRSPDNTTSNADRFSPTSRLSFASIQDPSSVVFSSSRGPLGQPISLELSPKDAKSQSLMSTSDDVFQDDFRLSIFDDGRANTNEKGIECRHIAAVGGRIPRHSRRQKNMYRNPPIHLQPTKSDDIPVPKDSVPEQNETFIQSRIPSNQSCSVHYITGSEMGSGAPLLGPLAPKLGHPFLYMIFHRPPLCHILHENQCADIASCVQVRRNPRGQMAVFHNKDFIVTDSCLLVSRKLPGNIVTPHIGSPPSPGRGCYTYRPNSSISGTPMRVTSTVHRHPSAGPLPGWTQRRYTRSRRPSSTPLSRCRDMRTGAQFAQEH